MGEDNRLFGKFTSEILTALTIALLVGGTGAFVKLNSSVQTLIVTTEYMKIQLTRLEQASYSRPEIQGMLDIRDERIKDHEKRLTKLENKHGEKY